MVEIAVLAEFCRMSSALSNSSSDQISSGMDLDLAAENDTCNRTLEGDLYSLVFPSDLADVWEARTAVWWVFYYLMVLIFGSLFLLLGILCIVLLVKRHLAQKFKVRTFIAIDVSLMILGFSRVVFLIFNPWNQYNFCGGHFACTAISRIIASLAFPSLTASYTLVFITLWMSARIQLGRSRVQKLKFLIPLCFVHYFIAVFFEILAALPFTSFPPVAIVVICQTIFSLWGFTVCFSFFFVGFRLLKSVERSARNSSMICKDSPNMSRHDLIQKSRLSNRNRQRSLSTMKLKHMLRDHHKRAIRKVTLITYVTVALGMLYSLLNLLHLVLIVLSLFDGCPGLIANRKQFPAVWLVLRYIFFSLEIALAVLLMYSISDVRPVVDFFRGCGNRCRARKKVVTAQSTNTTTPSDFQAPVTDKLEISCDENSIESKGTVDSMQFVNASPVSPVAKHARNGHAAHCTSPLNVSFSADVGIEL